MRVFIFECSIVRKSMEIKTKQTKSCRQMIKKQEYENKVFTATSITPLYKIFRFHTGLSDEETDELKRFHVKTDENVQNKLVKKRAQDTDNSTLFGCKKIFETFCKEIKVSYEDAELEELNTLLSKFYISLRTES